MMKMTDGEWQEDASLLTNHVTSASHHDIAAYPRQFVQHRQKHSQQ